MVVTELAVVTELVDRIEAGQRDAGDLLLGRVDQVEQSRERRAERQAAAALVAHLADAAQFLLDAREVGEVRVVVAERGGWSFGKIDLHGGPPASCKSSSQPPR